RLARRALLRPASLLRRRIERTASLPSATLACAQHAHVAAERFQLDACGAAAQPELILSARLLIADLNRKIDLELAVERRHDERRVGPLRHAHVDRAVVRADRVCAGRIERAIVEDGAIDGA